MIAAMHSALFMLLWTAPASAQPSQTAPDKTVGDQMADQFQPPTLERNYDRRVVMVPMRDGVKLFTVIFVPKGAHDAPIMLTRTPYNAASHVRNPSAPPAQALLDELPLGDEGFVEKGYLRVYQDVRGKYGSEGPYVMTPLPVNSGFNRTGADDTTDAWDTIEWLTKNVPESNGRVGMIGSSYEGFTVVMALLHPHPALKVAVPESPMVDGWMGDDWFHYGAFRQPDIDYVIEQMTARGTGLGTPRIGDEYTNYLNAGSRWRYGTRRRRRQSALYARARRTSILRRILAGRRARQADRKTAANCADHVGARTLRSGRHVGRDPLISRRLRAIRRQAVMNFLVDGSLVSLPDQSAGTRIGPVHLGDGHSTPMAPRRDGAVLNQYLKTGAPKANTPAVWVYDTGADHWDRLSIFPTSCESGCSVASKPLYLGPSGKLTFSGPAKEEKAERYTEFVSDPAKPVPYRPRPILDKDGSGWRTWLLTDQRFVDGRPDVLTFVSDPLSAPMKLSGEPVVHLDRFHERYRL